jgi:hypothetical protein
MNIAVTEADEQGQRHLVGWFDQRKAEQFNEESRRNGSSHVSANTGRPRGHQRLFRTAKGRWVLNSYTSQRGGEIGYYSYISDEQARDWLRRNNCEQAVRGPGRPVIGGRVTIPVGGDRLAAVDTWAQARGTSRGEAVRQLLDIALGR